MLVPFASAAVSASASREMLVNVFGFADSHPGQQAVVTRLIHGKSVLAVLPAGGGKSFCFQLFALSLDGLALIISPLMAPMKDQIDFLE